MNKVIPFRGRRQAVDYPAFCEYAAELLQDYEVAEDTMQWVHELLRDDDAYHALKELRRYMDMEHARETVIELKAWMEDRT